MLAGCGADGRHSIGLHRDDSYLTQPALLTVMKIKLYNESLFRWAALQLLACARCSDWQPAMRAVQI